MAKQFKTSKTIKTNTRWLKNAMKSLGMSTSDVIQEYAPNISEVVKTGQSAAASISKNIKKSNRSAEMTNRALQNNKYVKFAHTAYRNAISDLKTGKFNNEERMANSLLGGDDEGFSFSDDGAESQLNLSVDTGMAQFSDTYQRTNEANLKVQQASLNASIAMNAASMQQVGEIGTELVSQLTNINNSLAAIVQFNNDNMTKLVTASTAFFDKMGSAYDKRSGGGDTRMTAGDLIGANGSFNMQAYKKYVKEQFKDIPEISMMSSLLTDENLKMLASNPLGFASKAMVSYLMPNVVKGTIQSFEKSFNNNIPKLLMDLGDVADEFTGGLGGSIKGIIAKTFGIKLDRTNKLEKAKISRDAMPFDGETKNAIVNIITKELRDQTGYLEIIADKIVGPNSKAQARSKGEYWSWNSNKFVSQEDMNKEMAGSLVDAISDAFNRSTFGKGLNEIINSSDLTSANKDNVKNSLKEVYVQLERITKSGDLTLDNAISIINNSSLDNRSRKLIADYIKKMASSDFNGLHAAVASANTAANKAKEEMMEDSNYIYSDFYMSDDVDKLIDSTMGYGKENRKNQKSTIARGELKNALASNKQFASTRNQEGYNPFGPNGFFSRMKDSKVGAVKNIGASLFHGDISGAAEAFTTSLIDQVKITGSALKETMFGNKNGDGKFEGGAFSDLINSSVDSVKGVFRSIDTAIFGEEGIKGFKIENLLSDENKKWFEDHKINLGKQGKGAFAGGLIGTMIGGPVVGTVIGSVTGMMATSEKFHDFIFGSEETETVNGHEYKKEVGLVNKIGNYVNAYLLKPIKDEAKYVAKSILNSITGQIINPIKLAFQPVTEFMLDTGKEALKTIGNTILKVGKAGGSLLGWLFPGAANAFTKMNIFKADFGVRLGQGLLSIPTLGLEMFARLTGNDQLLENLKNNRLNFLNKQKTIKAARKEDRRHTKNAQLIAKLTNGRYSEDTEEARQYIKDLDPDTYERYFGNNKQGKKRGAAIDANRTTMGMDSETAANANIQGMNPESQQVCLLAQTKGILNNLVSEFTKFAEAHSGEDNIFDIEDNSSSDEESSGNPFEDAINDALSGNAPHFAKGGKVKKTGAAWVGENGAELRLLNKGDEILNQDQIADELGEKSSDEKRNSRKARIKQALMSAMGIKSIKLRSELAGLNAEELNDIRGDSLESTMKAAKSAEQLRKDKEMKDYQEAVKAKLGEIKTGVSNTTETIKDKFDNSIFSKKGVIGGILLALALKYPNLFGNALKAIVDIGTNVANFLAGIGGSVVDDVADQLANNDRSNGNSAGEELYKLYDDFTDLNIITDANGNINRHGTPAARYAGRMALDYANAGAKGRLRRFSPMAKRRDAVFTGMKKAGGFIKEVGGNVFGKKNAGTTGNAMLDVMQEAQVGGTKNSGLLKKCTDAIGKFFDMLFNKLPLGKEGKAKVIKILGNCSPKNLVSALKSSWDDIAKKIEAKLAPITGGKATAAAVTAGLSEVGFIALSSLDAVTGTAKLFRVDKSKVDGRMRTIAGVYGAIAGSTIGSILDIVLSILGQVIGVDIQSTIACALYKAWVGLDSDKAKELESNQDAWQMEYADYKESEIEKSYNAAMTAGTIDPSMTLDEYIAAVERGEIEVNYDSFQDWNTRQNASMMDKAFSTVGKIGKGLWKGTKAVGGAVVKGVKAYVKGYVNTAKVAVGLAKKGFKALTNTGWFAADGSYYKLESDKWTHYNLNGDIIEENCDNDTVVSMIQSGQLKSHSIDVTRLANNVVTTVVNEGQKLWKSASSVVKDAYNSLKDKVSTTWNNIKDYAKTGITKLKNKASAFVKENFGWFDTSGSYYKMENDKWNHYNINGDLIEEDCDTETVIELIKSGQLKLSSITVTTTANNAINTIKSGAKSLWKNAKTAWQNWRNGGQQVAGANGAFGGGFGKVNGSTYFSQNDSRWRNSAYNMGMDSATMGTSGCGPTAMAMAASDLLKGDVTPTSMAGLAELTGNRDSTGTNWNFINDSSRVLGLNSTQVYNPSKGTLSSQLATGNPVILSGTSNGGSTPFTANGHYVVAVGQDANGNVIVNDPRGRSYSRKYNLESVAKHTGSSWMLSRGGYGPAIGTDASTAKVASKNAKPSWLSVVKAVKQAIANQKPGYSKSNWITIAIDNIKKKIRTDCSGFVTSCLKYFGVADDNVSLSSRNFASKNDPVMLKTGFSPSDWNGWDNLLPGDIIARNGHVEIFAMNSNNKHYVYNCGSDSSVNNPDMTPTGHKDGYQTVWRPTNLGQDTMLSVSGADDSTVESTGEPEKKSVFSAITDVFGTMFESAIGGLLGGKKTNTFKDDLTKLQQSQMQSDETSSEGGEATVDTSSDSSLPATTVSDPKGNAKRIWRYLKDAGYSDAAAAAIMGNLQAESGLDPAIIQGKGKGPAAGLAQWENYNTKSKRWANLNNYATSQGKHWTDLDTQLNFLNNELTTLSSAYWKGSAKGMKNVGATGTTYTDFKASKDVAMATRQFEGAFERAGKPHIDNRIKYAKGFLEQYGGSGYGIPTARGGHGTATGVVTSKGYIGSFSNPSSNVTSSEMIKGIIKLLEIIATNTGDSSTKLDLLKNLSSMGSITLNSSGSNSAKTDTPVLNEYKETLSPTKAEKIARGY